MTEHHWKIVEAMCFPTSKREKATCLKPAKPTRRSASSSCEAIRQSPVNHFHRLRLLVWWFPIKKNIFGPALHRTDLNTPFPGLQLAQATCMGRPNWCVYLYIDQNKNVPSGSKRTLYTRPVSSENRENMGKLY